MIDHCPIDDLKAVVSTNLAELSTVQAENLVNRLAGETFPRLAVPFTQWGALLANPMQRQALYGRRLAVLSGSENAATQSLSNYLQGMCDEIATGWQSIETVFSLETQRLALGLRQSEQAEGKQAKRIQFLQENQTLRLALAWNLELDRRLAIRARLYPTENEVYLPSDVTFSLISAENTVLQSIQSTEANNYVQLKQFRCSPGYSFSLQIQLGTQIITETFTA